MSNGPPSPLPAATLPRIEITQMFCGICHMQVCAIADATDEEILAVCNRENPSGTSNGWSQVIRVDDDDLIKPVTCARYPERKHFMVNC